MSTSPPPWGVICQLVSKKREKLASEFIFNKDVKKNSFLHFMYTNYITTDSWFVPKERLSLLLLCFFLSFFLFLSHPLYSPSPLSLLIFIISERKHKGRREKSTSTILNFVFSFPISFVSSEMTLHLSKKETSLTLVPDRIRNNIKIISSFFFFPPIYRYYFSVILVVYKLQQAIVTPFSLPLFNRFAPISSYFPPAFQYFLFTSSVPNLSNRFVSLTQKLFLPLLLLSSPLNFILSFSTFLLFAARSANFKTT